MSDVNWCVKARRGGHSRGPTSDFAGESVQKACCYLLSPIYIFRTGQQAVVTQSLMVCVITDLLGCRYGGHVLEALYLSLRDDVEGAALLSLPDDELSFVIVFLKDTRTAVRSEAGY